MRLPPREWGPLHESLKRTGNVSLETLRVSEKIQDRQSGKKRLTPVIAMSRNADSSNEGADRTRPVQPVEQSQHEGVNASDQVILSGPVPVKNLIIPWKKRVCRPCLAVSATWLRLVSRLREKSATARCSVARPQKCVLGSVGHMDSRAAAATRKATEDVSQPSNAAQT